MTTPNIKPNQIDTPIKLLAAIVLLIEVVLTGIICGFDLDRIERIIIIIGMVVLALVIAGFLAYKVSRKEPEYNTESSPVDFQHDIFLSAAMASLDDQASYDQLRTWLLSIKNQLNDLGYRKAFYAAQDLADKNQFDDPGLAAKEDIRAIDDSEHFMFVYPSKVATSAIMELGYALAKGKRIWILVRNRKDLPYLLRGLDAAYNNVKITVYDNEQHFANLLKHSHREIFS